MSVKLSMPVGDRFRELAVDAAAKYAELSGCAAPAVAEMAVTVAAELGARAAVAAPESNLTLDFHSGPKQVDIIIDGSGPPVTVHCAVP